MLTGITRVRNESLILEDTLRHVLQRVDNVILYDDCSADQTVEIAASFDRVEVIAGDEWRADRPAEETRHRAILLDKAAAAGAEWCLCFDADERYVGAFPDLALDAYRFRLFDAYMTPDCSAPYSGGPLEHLGRLYGPEYRDIIMLFRVSAAKYHGRDRREPRIAGRLDLAPVTVKHFGKSLSVEQWEETCDYYATHWPEPYRSKWAQRRGKAVHTLSDFGRPLYAFDEVAAHGVPL